MNVFFNLIKSGKINNKEDLKFYFRILAKKLHPDTNQQYENDRQFIKLKNDFEDSLLLFPETVKDNRVFSRKDIYEAF